MLRLFTRTTSSTIRSAFRYNPHLTILPKATMSNSSANSHLKASDLFDVSHVTAVVTGGGTGIGLMIAQALVANGAKVYITGRRKHVLESTVQQYNSGPGSLHSLPGDVSDKQDVLRLAKEIGELEPNGIQLLVNNAGIARDDATHYFKNGQPDMSDPVAISEHFLKSEPENWEETLKTNVTAGFWTSMAFLPLLANGGKVTPGYSSSIVNVSSISGAMKGCSSGQFSYATSKAAFTHLSRMLALAFVDVKVRVNVIAPGVFPSEMTTGNSGGDNKSEMEMGSSNPAGRKGEDSDMAATILFLAGKGGVFYNESIQYVDGGNTIINPSQK